MISSPWSSLVFLLVVIPSISAVYFDVSLCNVPSSPSCVHVSPDGSDTNPGTLANPLKTITQAMSVANTRQPALIVLNDGIYAGGIVWASSNISLTSRNGANSTIIDGNMTTFGVRVDVDTTISTSISGIWIRRCTNGRYGGMVLVGEKTGPLLKDIIISDNVASTGGGLYVNLACPTLINVTAFNNNARQGGAIAVIGNIRPVIMINCTITQNQSPSSAGGGLFMSMAEVQAFNTTFSSNLAAMAGGIYCDSSIVVLNGCSVLSNIANYDDSGGLYSIRGVVSIADSLFRGNNGAQKGGAIKVFLSYHGPQRDFVRFPYDLTVYRTLFDANIGGTDGLVNIKDFTTAYLEDVTFTNNKCTANSAGFFIGANAQATIVRAKFIKGSSDFGAGMMVAGNNNVVCKQCTWIGNMGTADGGGVAVDKKGTLQLVDPILNGNTAAGNGGGLACLGKSTCTIVRGQFVNNNATLDGGAIHGLTATLNVNGTTCANNTARLGVGINVGLTTTATITQSTFQGQAGLAGNIYFVIPSAAPPVAQLMTNTYIDDTTSYGSQFATAPSQLSFLTDDMIVTSTQYDINMTNPVIVMMNKTIANVASFPLRIVLLDSYMQRVNTSQADLSDIFVSISPANNQTTQQAILVNLDRIRMPRGLASFSLGVAGQLGGAYMLTFSSSITGVPSIQLMVQIQPCGALDFVTFYPPGTSTYNVCNPATPRYMSSSSFIGIIVLCVFSITCVLITQLITFYFWNTPVFKGSTPSFMSLLLLGSLIGYIAIILENIDIDRTSQGMTLFNQLCQGTIWLLSIAFCLMFGTLSLKNWRIHRIFCNRHLQGIRDKVATSHLFCHLVLMLFVEIFINTLFNVYDPLTGVLQIVGNNYSATCHSASSNIYLGIMLAYNGLIALLCVFLAYRTRDVTHRFNESRQLMVASYNMCVSVIVVMVLTLTLPDIHAQRAAFSFGTWFVITSTWVILYVPKIFLAVFQSQRNVSSKEEAPTVGGSAKQYKHSGNNSSKSDHNSTERLGGTTTNNTGTNTPNTITPKGSSRSVRGTPASPQRVSLAMSSVASQHMPVPASPLLQPASPPLKGMATPPVPLAPLPSYPSTPHLTANPPPLHSPPHSPPSPMLRQMPLLNARTSTSSKNAMHQPGIPTATTPSIRSSSPSHLHFITDSSSAGTEPPTLNLHEHRAPNAGTNMGHAVVNVAESEKHYSIHGGPQNFV